MLLVVWPGAPSSFLFLIAMASSVHRSSHFIEGLGDRDGTAKVSELYSEPSNDTRAKLLKAMQKERPVCPVSVLSQVKFPALVARSELLP